MLKLTAVCCALLSEAVVFGIFDKFISKGRWVVDKTARCDNYQEYSYDIDIRKRKVNRTHDGFYVQFEFFEDLTEDDFRIHIDACMKVDGGCRSVIVFDDASFCRFLMKNAEKNFREVLKSLGTEENCPIPEGRYQLDDYIFDNREFPDEGLVGAFMATIEVFKGDEKMACFIIHVHFDELDDDDDWW